MFFVVFYLLSLAWGMLIGHAVTRWFRYHHGYHPPLRKMLVPMTIGGLVPVIIYTIHHP